ncbi:hypothetical protein D9M69_474020 [compost metagenome]
MEIVRPLGQHDRYLVRPHPQANQQIAEQSRLRRRQAEAGSLVDQRHAPTIGHTQCPAVQGNLSTYGQN